MLDATISGTRTTQEKGALIMKDVKQALSLNLQDAFRNICEASKRLVLVRMI